MSARAAVYAMLTSLRAMVARTEDKIRLPSVEAVAVITDCATVCEEALEGWLSAQDYWWMNQQALFDKEVGFPQNVWEVSKASGLGLGRVDPSVKSRLGAAALEKADEKLALELTAQQVKQAQREKKEARERAAREEKAGKERALRSVLEEKSTLEGAWARRDRARREEVMESAMVCVKRARSRRPAAAVKKGVVWAKLGSSLKEEQRLEARPVSRIEGGALGVEPALEEPPDDILDGQGRALWVSDPAASGGRSKQP